MAKCLIYCHTMADKLGESDEEEDSENGKTVAPLGSKTAMEQRCWRDADREVCENLYANEACDVVCSDAQRRSPGLLGGFSFLGTTLLLSVLTTWWCMVPPRG